MQRRAELRKRVILPVDGSGYLTPCQAQIGRWRSHRSPKNGGLGVGTPTDNPWPAVLVLLNGQSGAILDIELHIPMLVPPAPSLQLAPDTHREQRSARFELRVPGVLNQHHILVSRR